MKNSKRQKGQKIMSGALGALVMVLFLAPFELSADVCDEALEDCMIDGLVVSAVAFLAGLVGGPGSAILAAGSAGAGYAAFCATGWVFCKAYYL